MHHGPTELDDTLRAFKELNAVLLTTRSGASKTDICDRQIHN
jgi:replicative DNA helicase